MADSEKTAKDEAHVERTVTRRIARKRGLVWFNLCLEVVLPRLLWPVLAIALFASFAWLGVFYALPFALRCVLLLLLLVGFVVSLWPLSCVRLPSLAAAERRLEAQNGLRHQAIAVRHDKPATVGADALALWAAHQARMADRIRHLDSGLPAPDFSAVDPYGLRAIPVPERRTVSTEPSGISITARPPSGCR